MRIETLEKIRIPAGVRLRLTDAQLDARRYSVLPVDGIALVITPMDFKQGEIVDVDGSLPISIPTEQYQVLDDAVKPKKIKKQVIEELVDAETAEDAAAGVDAGLVDIAEGTTHA